LDFASLEPGQYVTDQLWDAYRVRIQATGGYSPDGAARIYDTSNPDGADPDLGSPNEDCGGPGKGSGGGLNSPYSNCVALGNVLIIQSSNKDDPDDSSGGGSITFEFDGIAFVEVIAILDIDVSSNGRIISRAMEPSLVLSVSLTHSFLSSSAG
jgi:hypothetical protein